MSSHRATQLTFITIGIVGVIAIGIALFAGGRGARTTAAAVDHRVTARIVTRHPSTSRPRMKLALHVRGHGAVRARGRRCATDCTFGFARGKAVALAPTAGPGWMFAGWAGYCEGNDLCRVDTVLHHAVTARFVPVPVPAAPHIAHKRDSAVPARPTRFLRTFVLTTLITRDQAARLKVEGLGSCADGCTLARGVMVKVRVMHDSDSAVRWTGAACTGDTCKVRMRRDRTVRARIVHASRTLTWSGLECDTDNCSPDKTSAAVTAPLHIQSRTLDVGSDGNGAVVVGGTRCAVPARCTWHYGDATSLTLTAEPADRFEFAGWDGCPEAVGPTCGVRLTNDRTITAHFREPATVEMGPS